MDYLFKGNLFRTKSNKELSADFKKSIDEAEKDLELFYKHQLERDKISRSEYAQSLKERYERYVQYSSDVLNVDFMTEAEKAELSRRYLRESEEALTDYYKNIIKIEEDAEKERQKVRKAARESLDTQNDRSVAYVSDRNYYSDWADEGDDPVSAFKRVDERLSNSVARGDISYEEYMSRISGFGRFMYEDRIDNSNRWLAHEREMNRISSEDYIAGLMRMMEYTREYYSEGMISHRTYLDGMRSLEERIFNERKAQHKEILKQAEKEKEAVDETANAKLEALEKQYKATLASMDEEDREDELSYLKAQEKVYANAQTKEGKDRLAEIREDIEEINDEKRRAALKEDFELSREKILSTADRKKQAIDKRAAAAALDFGLHYDEDEGYRMIKGVNSALSGVLTEQQLFSSKSKAEMALYNTELSNQMLTSTQSLSQGILAQFASFAAGVSAIKTQIFNEVASVNSLDFSRFGSKGKTTITYNDYGDKNISGGQYSTMLYDNLKALAAKGGRL